MNMADLLFGIPMLLSIAVIVMIIVIIAMAVDCVFGWHKAKERGEARTSYLFARTLNKFMLYEGLLIISTLIDLLIHFGWYQFVTSSHYVIPITAIANGILLCCVEVWSMREKADQKTKRNLDNITEIAAHVASQAISKEMISTAVAEALARQHPPEE